MQPLAGNLHHEQKEKDKKMKRAILLTIISIFMLACQSASVDKKDGEIKYKETVTLNDVPFSTLTFYEVSDSRCPEGVQCFWAGNATVDLALAGVNTEGKVSKHINMCIGDCRTLYKSAPYRLADTLDQEFAGQQYRFILEAVSPAPKADSTVTKAAYSILLKVERK